jgi:hypothetical protein
VDNLYPGKLAYLPPDHLSIGSLGYQQALSNACNNAQRQLSLAYQQGNYNPLTSDIDAKLLEARLKQNRAKHKIQDMMMRRRHE